MIAYHVPLPLTAIQQASNLNGRLLFADSSLYLIRQPPAASCPAFHLRKGKPLLSQHSVRVSWFTGSATDVNQVCNLHDFLVALNNLADWHRSKPQVTPELFCAFSAYGLPRSFEFSDK
ncbi:hypothetical protein OH492_07785 [Vibrio chagasii]|nr:hypothetical protein [Vibrio chagasii]